MTGRQQERARFRPPRPIEEGPQLLDPRLAARESVLTAAGFWRDEGGEWCLADPEALDELGGCDSKSDGRKGKKEMEEKKWNQPRGDEIMGKSIA